MEKNKIDFSQEFNDLNTTADTSADSNVIPQIETQSKSKIGNWLIKHSFGLIKNENQANSIMIIYVVVAILITIFILFSTGVLKI